MIAQSAKRHTRRWPGIQQSVQQAVPVVLLYDGSSSPYDSTHRVLPNKDVLRMAPRCWRAGRRCIASWAMVTICTYIHLSVLACMGCCVVMFGCSLLPWPWLNTINESESARFLVQ